jgi:hypothetical protein
MRDLIVLWMFLVLTLALYGQELFSYRARFSMEPNGYVKADNAHGHPPSINYEGIGNSLMAIFNIFYNEEWHVAMFWHARTNEQTAIIFYVVTILLC